MDQEFLADQETVEQVGSSAAYATRLVALAAPTEATPSLKPLSASVPLLSGWWWDGGLKTPLLQRVVMLLHCALPGGNPAAPAVVDPRAARVSSAWASWRRA